MAVVAKFRVQSRTESASWTGEKGKTQESVKLMAVSDPANENWSKWTPAGSIELTITNPAALDQFKVGEEFLVTFTPAAIPPGVSVDMPVPAE